jgi:hypothetical protein
LLWQWFSSPAWQKARRPPAAAVCPVDTSQWKEKVGRWFEVGYEFEYVDQDQYRVGSRSAGFGEVRGHHDEAFTLNRTHRFILAAGLTDRLSLEARLPVISRSHSHVHHHHGEDILGAWDLHGAGDLSLVGRFVFYKPRDPRLPQVAVTLGGEAPTGTHHHENDEDDQAEPAIQPGSNSWDMIAGLSMLQPFQAPTLGGVQGPLSVFASATGQFNGPGTNDYRLGDSLQASVGAAYPLTERLWALAQVNCLIRDRDGIGSTREEVAKTGGEFIYLSPGLELLLPHGWRAYGLVQLPVYQRVNSLQVVSDINLLAGLRLRFD